jgi:hypothetical protein
MLSINNILMIIGVSLLCYFIFTKTTFITKSAENFTGDHINFHHNDDYNVYPSENQEPNENN